MESLTFTKQADGWYAATLTIAGQNTLVQLEREFVAGGNSLIVLASMDGLPPVQYKKFDGCSDANLLLDIKLPNDTAVTIRSMTEVKKALYGFSNTLVEKTISENGTYEASDDDALGYSKVIVDAAPSGELIEKNINDDGTYKAEDDEAYGYSKVVVDTSGQLMEKNIAADGTYNASSDNKKGYSKVVVDTSSQLTTKNITENGTYNASSDGKKGYSRVVVNVQSAVEPEYLCIRARKAGSTIGMTHNGTNASSTKPVIYYSIDKQNWTLWTYSTITLANEGDKIWMYGSNPNGVSRGGSNYSNFTFTGAVEVLGNVYSLISTTFNIEQDTLPAYCFGRLFRNCYYMFGTSPKLLAKKISRSCYARMFEGCLGLISPSELPAGDDGSRLPSECYLFMYANCISLLYSSKLPATKVGDSSYYNMYSGCTSLIKAEPIYACDFYAESLYSMFKDDTALKSAELGSLSNFSFDDDCLYRMFYGCSSLENIVLKALTWSSSYATDWVKNVKGTGTFKCPGTLSITMNSTSGVPAGWTRSNL